MKNTTISLYAFHLGRTFNDPPDRVSESSAKSFGKELQDKLTKQINLKNELITLLLHDTYFTDLTFSAPETDFTSDQIEQFNPSAFLPQNINASIGQTIGIYSEVSCKMEANQALADSYVRIFLKDTQYKNDKITASNQSNLLGIPLFEYFCQTTAIPNTQEPVCHILVLLNYQDKNGLKKLGDCYEDIVELLCSYHKIKFVYQQAQVSYQAALKASQEIEKEIDNFVLYVADKNKNLNNLSEMLEKLPLLDLKHSNYCGELELSLTTIEINHQNYKNSLQKLLSEGSQLDSWQKFSDRIRDTFLKQIQCWLNYMSPRKELGQQLTASIRGIVEIEQTEIDRQLQTTIAVVGAGIGVAGVVAASTPYLIKQEPGVININNPFSFNVFATFMLVIFLSLGAGLLTWKAASYLINRKRNNKVKLQGESTQNQASLAPGQGADMSSILQQKEKERSHTSKNS